MPEDITFDREAFEACREYLPAKLPHAMDGFFQDTEELGMPAESVTVGFHPDVAAAIRTEHPDYEVGADQ